MDTSDTLDRSDIFELLDTAVIYPKLDKTDALDTIHRHIGHIRHTRRIEYAHIYQTQKTYLTL